MLGTDRLPIITLDGTITKVFMSGHNDMPNSKWKTRTGRSSWLRSDDPIGRRGAGAHAYDHRNPTVAQLAQRLIAARPQRLANAAPGAMTALRSAVTGWIEDAIEVGYTGWRALDLVYGEQRLHRWDRTRLMRHRALYVPAFNDIHHQRALASLPLSEKLRDGFHRRFIKRFAPDLLPAPPKQQRKHIPGPARRLKRLLDSRRHRPNTPTAWPFADQWKTRPATQEWISDEILAHPALDTALGPSWVQQTRQGFLAGETAASQTTLAAAAPLVLDLLAQRELASP